MGCDAELSRDRSLGLSHIARGTEALEGRPVRLTPQVSVMPFVDIVRARAKAVGGWPEHSRVEPFWSRCAIVRSMNRIASLCAFLTQHTRHGLHGSSLTATSVSRPLRDSSDQSPTSRWVYY